MFSPSEIVTPKPRYYRITYLYQDEFGTHYDHVYLKGSGGRHVTARFWRFVYRNVELASCVKVQLLTMLLYLDD